MRKNFSRRSPVCPVDWISLLMGEILSEKEIKEFFRWIVQRVSDRFLKRLAVIAVRYHDGMIPFG